MGDVERFWLRLMFQFLELFPLHSALKS